jgi:hypothetical protein
MSLHAIEQTMVQAMLVTPFALVMPQIRTDCCGPPVSVVDPSLSSTHRPGSPRDLSFFDPPVGAC